MQLISIVTLIVVRKKGFDIGIFSEGVSLASISS